MNNPKNSRFITHPSLVVAEHATVVIVDADGIDIERVGLFCKTSKKDYDIWLYRTDLNDAAWIAQAIKQSVVLLQRAGSSFNVYHKNVIYFGNDSELKSPVQWFEANDD